MVRLGLGVGWTASLTFRRCLLIVVTLSSCQAHSSETHNVMLTFEIPLSTTPTHHGRHHSRMVAAAAAVAVGTAISTGAGTSAISLAVTRGSTRGSTTPAGALRAPMCQDKRVRGSLMPKHRLRFHFGRKFNYSVGAYRKTCRCYCLTRQARERIFLSFVQRSTMLVSVSPASM